MATDLEESKQTVYKEYDPKFTEDISKRMQMPDRLVPGNENDTSRFNYHLRDNQDFNHPLSSRHYEESRYVLSTPPNSIKNFYGTTLADDGDDDDADNYTSTHENDCGGPNGIKQGEDDLLMTPGTILLMRDGNNLAALQRQVAKLARRVARLQEESVRRGSRDLLLYPLLVGFFLFQIGRSLFSRP